MLPRSLPPRSVNCTEWLPITRQYLKATSLLLNVNVRKEPRDSLIPVKETSLAKGFLIILIVFNNFNCFRTDILETQTTSKKIRFRVRFRLM